MDDRSVSILSWDHDHSPISIVDFVLGQARSDDIAIHRAIGRRLAETGLNQPVDKVFADARKGEAWAVDIIRTSEFPAPADRLPMPAQDFGSNRSLGWLEGIVARLVPGRKRAA